MPGTAARALGSLLGVASLLGCATVPLHARPWVEVRTPNFSILSQLPEAESLELARNLELFRSVVERMTGGDIPPSPVPVQVVAFDSPATHRRFSYRGSMGFFSASMRQSAIVLGDWGHRGVEVRTILQHEYVHFLLRNRSRRAYPPWYDEGFAQFLSSVAATEEGVEIGRAVSAGLRDVGNCWYPLEDLLSRRTFAEIRRGDVGAFYTQSWAFVHYLHFGRKDAKARTEMTRYLDALKRGEANEDAVRHAFGESSGTLGHKLRRYIERRRFSFLIADRERFGAGPPPRARAADAGEVALALGTISNQIAKYPQGEAYFRAALGANPVDGRARSGLAVSLAGQERWEAAAQQHRAALAAGPDDALVHLDFAGFRHGQAKRADEAADRERLAEEARAHYVRAWKLDESIPETYAGYGSSFLLDGQDAARGLQTLEHAHRLLPASPEIKLSLARLYAEIDRPDEARELAYIVSTWSHSDERSEEIRELLGQIGGRAGGGEAEP